MDAAKTPEQRADALLAASSQHQKYRWLVEQPADAPQQTDFEGVVYLAQLPCTPQVTYTDGPDGVRFTEGVTAFLTVMSASERVHPIRVHRVENVPDLTLEAGNLCPPRARRTTVSIPIDV
ncbi:hypothetical protein SAMN06295885_1473 [Rathayibacter oskolensis]|uniref:Uncharacterized protein n=2 Tax=Rathayibacter oskolensis TaxID=1891671 RepID=A0A1X7NME8_9MICO|nr:hypothetical protein SAMN06295885_1473 [Rathayibacter oskolensis]